ncbi:MAG: choice-of-anchor tandem repeat GloVer-containing protein [Terriglobales bacterium]
MTHQGRTARNLIVAVVATLMLAVSALAARDSQTVLYTFTGGSDGAVGGVYLVSDSVGNLYGTTAAGGNKSTKCAVYTGQPGCGVVFKLTPTAQGPWKETVLHTFTGGADGGVPEGGVILDSSGNLYGTTYFGGDSKPEVCHASPGFAAGCGVVYKLTPTAHGPWEETVLHTFTGAPDGQNPLLDQLILDSNGNLYGTTQSGGDEGCIPLSGCGVVFELSPSPTGAWTERILYAFSSISAGFNVVGSVTLDSQGNLYGSTHQGGDTSASCYDVENGGCGVVFKLTPTPSGPWTETVLYAFTGGSDGASPQSGVILDSAGNVYGTANFGGDTTSPLCTVGQPGYPGCGVVFELAQGTWEETVLYTFTGSGDGWWPLSPLVFDSSGNLYGETLGGGGHNDGIVFKLTPDGQGQWTESKPFVFSGGAGGNNPQSSLVFGLFGRIYGMTDWGGDTSQCNGYGCGVVYELQP